MRKTLFFGGIFLVTLAVGVSSFGQANSTKIVPMNDWIKIEPSDAGISERKVKNLFDLSFSDPATQATVLIKNGQIVGERYQEGFHVESYGTSWSMAKSFYAALVGISLDYGEIDSLDDFVSDYIPTFGDERADITIRHLLNMTSGLDFPAHEHELMFLQENHLEYAVNTKFEKSPGQVFEYNNVNSMLLAAILSNASGKPADQLMQERIFSKIGIENYTLWRDSFGNPLTYCCVDMSARDFSRFGLLFARKGMWGSEKVLSSDYVDETFKEIWSNIESKTINQKRGYGMHWWISRNNETSRIFNASGKFGQYIFVDPDNDVVFTRITRYRPTGGAVQNLGTLRFFLWINDLTFLRKFGERLTSLGLIDLGGDLATPHTFENGISKQFFRDYPAIVDALADL